MAIAKIKKIEIIGLKDNQDEILTLLQRLGIVDLINIRDRTADKSPAIIPSDINLLEIEEAISFLASFSNKATFLESIANLKPIVYQEELKNVINNFGWQAFINELSVLRSRLKDLIHHKDNLIQRKQLLLPWRNLGLSLDQMHQTQYCDIFLGILLSRDYQDLLQKALKENINFYSEVISQDKTNTYLSVLYIREDFERLETILKNYHFNFVTLGHYKGKVKDNLFEISNDTLILNDQIQEIKNKIIQLTKEQFKLKVIYDHLNVINKRKQADKNLSGQEYTFALSGWIKYKEIKFLEKELSHSFKEIAIFISEPKEGESVPVVLENRRLIQPFEFVTQIYGMPKYNELDPTPFLAPFFFLYFGFCVSDAGYGFILVLISWFILKKFKMGSQGNKFWRLFLFCGISTIIIGALTGSWFGNALDLLSQTNKIFLPLKRSKDSLTLFDPLKEPTKLLGIALFLGIIQVWFGNIVAGIGNIKNKRYLDIVLDQIPMLTLLFGLTGLGLIFLKLLDNTHIGLFKYATIFASVALIFTQGRSEKGLGSKFFYGIYNLYNALSGYLSDILSYSRLWALGLVTGVMAMTINLIAMQFSQILVSMIPSIDKIIFIKILISASVIIIIFILGHAISFLINLIGAFVHPVRLQFVEFFSKFFKSGGNSFKPFKIETKYINIS